MRTLHLYAGRGPLWTAAPPAGSRPRRGDAGRISRRSRDISRRSASGDTATCRAHVVAYHQVPTAGVDFCVMRGYWEIGPARIQGRWAINRWTIVRTAPWEGDPDVYRIAAERSR